MGTEPTVGDQDLRSAWASGKSRSRYPAIISTLIASVATKVAGSPMGHLHLHVEPSGRNPGGQPGLSQLTGDTRGHARSSDLVRRAVRPAARGEEAGHTAPLPRSGRVTNRGPVVLDAHGGVFTVSLHRLRRSGTGPRVRAGGLATGGRSVASRSRTQQGPEPEVHHPLSQDKAPTGTRDHRRRHRSRRTGVVCRVRRDN